MRRLMSMAAVLALVGAYSIGNTTPAARAFEVWCDNDPMVQINGVTVNITVSVWQSALPEIKGSVPVVILVPDGSTTSVLASGSPQPFPENVQFVSMSQATRAAAILGLPSNDVDEADGSAFGGRGGNQVTVLAVVPSTVPNGFGTKLSTSRSHHVVTGQSDQWMSVSFELSGKN